MSRPSASFGFPVCETRAGGDSYVCEGGVSNAMDYCSNLAADASGSFALTGIEILNACQQDRAATQRRQYMTGDGEVDYIRLAGLRGEGACENDAHCGNGEFCTAGVLDLRRARIAAVARVAPRL